MNNFRYRITIDNDFQNSWAFIDYKHFGEMSLFEVCYSKGPKERTLPSSGIGIFLNYNKIAFFKNKAEALEKIEELIKNCPKEAHKEFTNYSSILTRDLL